MDAEACGPWSELKRTADQVASKVVPRLLSSLVWQGKPIKPRLIHGDLWDANVGTVGAGNRKITKSYPNIAILYLVIPHLNESYPSPRPAQEGYD